MADPFGLGREPRLVYEDGRFLAVDKPCRMHSAPGAEPGDLCSWVFERYPEAAAARAPESAFAPRRPAREGGLLHRLDFETSGLVLFARDDESFAFMLKEQDEGRFLKEYLALSSPADADNPRGSRPARGLPLGIDEAAWAEARERGELGSLASLVEAPLPSGGAARIECSFRSYGPSSRAVACIGGPSSVAYRAHLLGARIAPPPDRAEAEEALELRLLLERGFRHQLRAQLAWVGLPIIGDGLYGGAAAGRLYLRAARVAFPDPDEDGRAIVIGEPGAESPGAESAMAALASLLFGPKADRLSKDG